MIKNQLFKRSFRHLRGLIFLIALTLLSVLKVSAQTIFSENFESVGTTAVLPNGGWTSFDVTAGNSMWGNGAASCVISGTKSLFVCRASIANTCDYAPASITNRIAYKTFSAAGYNTLLLNFKWKCNGETISGTDYDYGKVCYSTNGTTWTDLPTVYHLQTTTQTVTNLALPASLDGAATVYLGFRWINDVSTKIIPGFVVDDITLTATASPVCTTPTASPTALSMTASSATAATGSFTAASGADSYLVMASAGAFTGAASITDGTTYTTGQVIGNGTVIQSSSSTAISIPSGLTGNKTYTITVFSQNSSCLGGPKYKTTTPLTGTFITCPVVPASITVSGLSSSGFTLNWASSLGSSAAAVSYTLDVSTNNTFTAPISGSPFTVNDPTVTKSFTGLTQNVTYYYRIRANGNCNSLYSTTSSIATPCPAITTLPIVEGFNTIGTTPPTCWDTTLVTSTQHWTFAAADGDAQFAPHSGAAMAVKNWNSSASDALLITQPINLTAQPTTQARVNVWIHRSTLGAAGDRIRFFVNSIPSTAGATSLIDVLAKFTNAPIVASAGWYNYVGNIPLSYNTGGDFYIIAEGNTGSGTGSYSVGIDDLRIENVPSCFAPPSASVSALTATSATLNWTASVSSPGNGYVWEVRTSGAGGSGPTGLTETGTTAVGVLSANTTTPLTANTPYTLYVQSVCDAVDSSLFVSYAFTTPCSATGVPYVQDFESVTVPAIPVCTSIQNAGSGNNWITSAAPGSGFTSKTLQYTYNASSAANAWFYTQGLNLTAGSSYKLIYRYGNNSASFAENLEVKLGTSPSSGSMSTLVDVHAGINDNAAHTATVTFIAPTTAVYYLGFHAYSAADQFYLFVDDINVTLLPPCSGTPNASSTVSTLTTVCPSNSFTLSLNPPYDNTGLTYQWQVSSDNNTFNNISGANNTTYTTTQSSTSYYRAIITCSNGGASVNSSSVQVSNTPLASCYCIPAYSTGCASDKITNFVLSSLSNNSGTTCSTSPAGYSLYGTTPSNLTTGLVAGQSYTATITTTNTANSNGTGVGIWIDYNDNGAFDVSEGYNAGAVKFASNSTNTITVSVPSNAPVGNHRLRVVASRNTNGNAVGSCTPGNAAGETEDYTIAIVPAGCIGQPTAPANGSTSCAQTSTILSWPAFPGASGYSVFFGTSNPATTLVTTNQAGLTYDAGALPAGTYYWSVVPNSGATFCSTWSFTLLPAPEPSISNAGSVCVGFPITLGAANNASGQNSGNTFSWSTNAVTPFSSTSSTASVTSNATVNNSGNYTVVVTNSFLCTASATENVTVNPNPVLNAASISDIINESCPGASDGSFQATASSGTPPFDYSIDGGNSSNQSGSFTGLTPGTYTVQVVSDFNGCVSASTPVTITSPNLPATVSCPGNQSVNTGTGLCSAVVTYSTGSTGIPAPAITYEFSGATTGGGNGNGSGSAFNVGTTTVTVTATNSCGTDICSFDVVVTDNENPVITCPATANLTVDAGLCTSSASIGTATATDNCAGATVSHSPAGPYPVGTTTVTWTATDASGNTATCTQSVIVTDTENPVITCPATANLTADAGLCTSSGSIGTATATDNCAGATVSHTPAGPYPVGTTTVTWTATDASGNTATCAQSVIVTDTENPVITCPATANITADAGLCTSSASIGTATATDNCAGAIVSHSPAGPYPVGTTTVTWTATDASGNTATCTQSVIVTDTQNPVITCPANVAVCDPGSPVVNFSVTATDNCSIASVVSTPASGSTFPPGTTTVNSVATDVNGNTSTCSFTVTVSTPSTAPTSISTNADNNNICLGNSVVLTVNGGSLGTGAVYNWYTGSCGGTLAGTGSSITKSPTATTTYYVRAEGACNTTTCASVTVVVSTSPVTSLALMPFTGMPSNVCAGTVATLSIAPVSRATYYVWDVPTGSYFNGNPLNVSPFTTTTPSVTVTFGSPSGSLYNIGVQAGNACGTSVRQSQKVRGLTSVPASVSGPTTACANSTVTYSTAAVTGATSYLWTVTGNATVSGTGTTATVSFGAGYTGGTVCVAAQTTCYTSPTKCITISTSASTLNAISGTFTACPNSTLTYSVPASTGAATYTWTLPPGATGSSTTNSINVTYGAGYSAVGSICVSVTSTCGVTSVQKCKSVAPGLPSQPGSIAGPTNGLCGQSVVYTCPSQGSGTTYTWTVPAGASIISGQGTSSVNVSFGTFITGSVCVTANNNCGSSTSRCITVKGAPATPGAITATPGSWCAGASGIEFNVNVSGLSGVYTLNWTYPSAPIATYALGGGNSAQLVMDWGTGSGSINVVAFNACGSGTKTSSWSSTCREGEVASISSITVSPNPTTGILNINYTASKGSTVLNILDLAGRAVMTQAINSIDGANTTQLDMSKLAKGAYMLNVQSTQGNQQVRVVVE